MSNHNLPESDNCLEILHFLTQCDERERRIFSLGMTYTTALHDALSKMPSDKLAQYLREIGSPDPILEDIVKRRQERKNIKWYQFWR